MLDVRTVRQRKYRRAIEADGIQTAPLIQLRLDDTQLSAATVPSYLHQTPRIHPQWEHVSPQHVLTPPVEEIPPLGISLDRLDRPYFPKSIPHQGFTYSQDAFVEVQSDLEQLTTQSVEPPFFPTPPVVKDHLYVQADWIHKQADLEAMGDRSLEPPYFPKPRYGRQVQDWVRLTEQDELAAIDPAILTQVQVSPQPYFPTPPAVKDWLRYADQHIFTAADPAILTQTSLNVPPPFFPKHKPHEGFRHVILPVIEPITPLPDGRIAQPAVFFPTPPATLDWVRETAQHALIAADPAVLTQTQVSPQPYFPTPPATLDWLRWAGQDQFAASDPGILVQVQQWPQPYFATPPPVQDWIRLTEQDELAAVDPAILTQTQVSPQPYFPTPPAVIDWIKVTDQGVFIAADPAILTQTQVSPQAYRPTPPVVKDWMHGLGAGTFPVVVDLPDGKQFWQAPYRATPPPVQDWNPHIAPVIVPVVEFPDGKHILEQRYEPREPFAHLKSIADAGHLGYYGPPAEHLSSIVMPSYLHQTPRLFQQWERALETLIITPPPPLPDGRQAADPRPVLAHIPLQDWTGTLEPVFYPPPGPNPGKQAYEAPPVLAHIPLQDWYDVPAISFYVPPVPPIGVPEYVDWQQQPGRPTIDFALATNILLQAFGTGVKIALTLDGTSAIAFSLDGQAVGAVTLDGTGTESMTLDTTP